MNFSFKRVFLFPWFWVLFCSAMFAYPIYRSVNRVLPEELPKLYRIPSFSLIDENKEIFGDKELKGKVYIASFFFTSCPTICPKISHVLAKIQHRLRGVRGQAYILSFTVDPEKDRPEKLFKYAREYGANPFIWKFLTGEMSSVQELLTKGFMVAMGLPESLESDVYDIAHSARLILVDQTGNVRGFYTTDKKDVDQLMIDVGLLINREKLKYKN